MDPFKQQQKEKETEGYSDFETYEEWEDYQLNLLQAIEINEDDIAECSGPIEAFLCKVRGLRDKRGKIFIADSELIEKVIAQKFGDTEDYKEHEEIKERRKGDNMGMSREFMEKLLGKECFDAVCSSETSADIMREAIKTLPEDIKCNIATIEGLANHMHEFLDSLLSFRSSREIELAKKKIEEAVMWATKAISK